ncbi:MAG: hypothetical protein QM496_13805 [Verrucomicrobiota bacterium]
MNYKIDVKLKDGGRCQLVVRDACSEVSACVRVRGLMLDSKLIAGVADDEFEIKRVVVLRAESAAEHLVEMAVVVLFAVGIPLVGFYELLMVLGS